MVGGCVVLVLTCFFWWWLGRSPDYPVREQDLSSDEKWQVYFIAEKVNEWDVSMIHTKDGARLPAWSGTDGTMSRLVYKKEGLWRDVRNGEPATVFLVVRRSGLSPENAKDIIHVESGQLRSRAQIKMGSDWKAALQAVENNNEDGDGWRNLVLGELVQSVALVADRVIFSSKDNRLQVIAVGKDGSLSKRK
jgi:hypothetical protein